MMQGLQCITFSDQQRSQQRVVSQTNEIEPNIEHHSNSVDLKAKIRLLQSKLHPLSLNNKVSQEQELSREEEELQHEKYQMSKGKEQSSLIDGKFSAHKSCQLNDRLEFSDEQSFTPSPADDELELDSLSLASSSSSSTAPPTPPPRFSSLQRGVPRIQTQQHSVPSKPQPHPLHHLVATNEISQQLSNNKVASNQSASTNFSAAAASFKPILNERHASPNSRSPLEAVAPSSASGQPASLNNNNHLPKPLQRRSVALTSDNESNPLATHASLPVVPLQRQQASYSQNPLQVGCVRGNMIIGQPQPQPQQPQQPQQQQRPLLARNNPTATTTKASRSAGPASNLISAATSGTTTATATAALLPQVTNISESQVKPQQLKPANQQPHPFLQQQQHHLNHHNHNQHHHNLHHHHHHANQLAPTTPNLNPHKTSIKPTSASFFAAASNKQPLQQQLMPRVSNLNNNNYSQTTCYNKSCGKENCNQNKLPQQQQQQQQQSFPNHSTTCSTATSKPLPAPDTNGILCQPLQHSNNNHPANQVVHFTATHQRHQHHQHHHHHHNQQQHHNQAFQEAGFGPNSRAPITKAVQEMINLEQQQQQQQQQLLQLQQNQLQQATFVINEPSSRHPIRGCALPPIPVNATPFKQTKPLLQNRRLPDRPGINKNQQHINNLGSVSSASMSSISSLASSSTSVSNLQATTTTATQQAAINSIATASPSISMVHLMTHQMGAQKFLKHVPANKYSKDSERYRLKSKYCSINTENGENVCGRSNCLRRLRKRFRSRLQRGGINTTSEEFLSNNFAITEEGEIINDEEDEEQEDFHRSSFEVSHLVHEQPRIVNFVVDEDGDHTILAPESYDQLELNHYSQYMNQEELGEISSSSCNHDGLVCHDQYEGEPSSPMLPNNCIEQQQHEFYGHDSSETTNMIINGQIVRGWSEKFATMSDELFQAACQDGDFESNEREDYDDGDSITMWPLVELHENPLNSLEFYSNNNACLLGVENCCEFPLEQEDCCSRGGDDDDSEQVDSVSDSKQIKEGILDRSRLLSLREGQRKNRAAIRMISPDSVQLLVAATQEQSHKQEEEQEQEQCELKVENGEQEKTESKQSSLFMMQQQQHQQWQKEYSEVLQETNKLSDGEGRVDGLVSSNEKKEFQEEEVDEMKKKREKDLTLHQNQNQNKHQQKGEHQYKGTSKENNDNKPPTQVSSGQYQSDDYTSSNSNNSIKNMVPQREKAPSAAGRSEMINPVSSSSSTVSSKETFSSEKELTTTHFVEQASFSDNSSKPLLSVESMTTSETTGLFESSGKKSIDRKSCEEIQESCLARLEASGQQFEVNDVCLQTRKESSVEKATEPTASAAAARTTVQLPESAKCLQVDSNSNSNSSNVSACEQQRSARQAELLQLIRQRQQQLAINSSRSSQELPTLQQLQQQIQQQQQQQQRSNLPNSLQQQRMQQWTAAAAAMVEQQQQQRQQQHNESWRSNATSVPLAEAASTTTLEMELEQTRATQIATPPTTTTSSITTQTKRNLLSQPHLSLNLPIRESEFHNHQQYSINSNISQSKAEQQQQQECDVNKQHYREEKQEKISFHEPYFKQPQAQIQHQQPVKQQLMSPKKQYTEQQQQQQQQRAQNLLTTALNCGSGHQMASSPNQPPPPSLLNGGEKQQIQTMPIPSPRLNSQSSQEQVNSCLQTELSILTSTPNTVCLPVDLKNSRLRELSSIDSITSPTSAQSTPSHSILSDSTTLITEAAMNSCELIPKLIERLDRKLIVMKEEQLSLLREIELNESTGQRLFEYMKQHLTVNEYEKISLHANEIEKVTKLILSLKSRLKKVEVELKERSKLNKTRCKQQQYQSIKSTLPINDDDSQKQQSDRSKNNSSQQQQQENNLISKQTIRGVSDPTSTIGLPKRNHQHHASLQLSTSTPSSSSSSAAAAVSEQSNKLITANNIMPKNKADQITADGGSFLNARHDRQHHHQLSLTSSSSGGCSSSNESRSSRVSSPTRNQTSSDVGGQQDTKTASSTSSDSIFNCADSAIGSTITGHGGSVTNIEQPTVSQSSLTSNSSTTSSTTRNRHHHHHHHHHQNNMSSNMSVSSHSSMSTSSSVPNSPQLVSPVNNSSHDDHEHEHDHDHHHHHQIHLQRGGSKTPMDSSNVSLNNSDSNNNSDSMTHLLTDADILMAKRNKLVSQLEEAHQLEECIVRRNNIIIERILKKYFSEPAPVSGLRNHTQLPGNDVNDNENQEIVGGEIAEFKQYTRLKSLLLKDTHDIADRIDNAELQLNELKQTNHQRVL